MTIDQFNLERAARGHVRTSFIKGDEALPVSDCANVITYGAADMLTQLIAGLDAAPSAIGVIYGGAALPTLSHPSLTRDHTWESVAEQVAAIPDGGGNVAITPLTLAPSLQSGDSNYAANTAVFSANTGAVSATVFSGEDYAGALDTLDPVYFYQVLLLCGNPGAYTIFARSTLLDSGVYKSRPDGYELAIQWAVTIK